MSDKEDKMLGCVARMGEKRNVQRAVWWWNLRGRDHFEDLGTDGRIILKYILKEQFGSLQMVSYGLG
jgi:hypothetical protein